MPSDGSSAMIPLHLAKLEAVLSAAINAIITIDARGLIESANPATLRLFGYTSDELVGGNVKILMPRPFAAEHDGYLEKYLKSGERQIIGIGREVHGRRKDGSTFPVHLAVSEFSVRGERYFVGIITDLTESRAQSQAAKQALDDSERRLAQAQKMEAIGLLAGGIAHDFNNLLTVITGNLELIEPQLTDERLRTQLQEVQDAATSGANLTHRLLAFSRQLPLAPQAIEVNTLVLRTSELLRRTLGEHIALATSLSPELWPVHGDPAQVESALLNLAINARDAMQAGGRLVIETRNVTINAEESRPEIDLKPGRYAAIAVSDTGCGIPPELRDRVFEPFFTTKGQQRGSGLGLAMVYGFAKQSGGHVTVVSEVGRGTTFTIYLPKADISAEAPVSAKRTEPNAHPSETLVLIVEDDDAVRRLGVMRLEHLGYQVAEASSGAQALRMLNEGLNPRLILSDAIMPGGVSGRELLDRAQIIVPEVKVLLTSGYSEDFISTGGTGGLGHRILRKPHALTELAEAIRQSLA